ncbi:MAG: glucosamine-6-phosphate deaminase [Clostridiales bacterium]|nr:glucosamine-6-phosphate deaminase [Clostridiales bacterium]
MKNIRIYKEKDYESVSRRAATLISAQVISKPDSILGLATGSSPIGAYHQLAAWCQKGDVDFSLITSVNLDEYVGLAPDNSASYHYFMKKNFYSNININMQNTHLPDGYTSELQDACKHYDSLIQKLGGIDLQLLGIGNNGHIGFNEPGDNFILGTHIVNLTESTIKANSRLFDKEEDVPRQAITMGIGNIFQAEKIVLIACGHGKADALCRALTGPVTPEVPASILQLHKNLTIVADEEALYGFPEDSRFSLWIY